MRRVLAAVLACLAVFAGAAYATTRAKIVTISSACVHHGGRLYVGRCASGDRRVSFAPKPITASGLNGPQLAPGTYYVDVEATIPFLPHPQTGVCDAAGISGAYFVPQDPGTSTGSVGLPLPFVFSFSGVITVSSTEPDTGIACIRDDGAYGAPIVPENVKWWVFSLRRTA